MITEAGRGALRVARQAEMFRRLREADPTSAKGLDPWDGRSPRDLTDSAIRFRLGNEGASLNEVDAQIEEQRRRHLYGW